MKNAEQSSRSRPGRRVGLSGEFYVDNSSPFSKNDQACNDSNIWGAQGGWGRSSSVLNRDPTPDPYTGARARAGPGQGTVA